ncbi:hypothetical protein ACOHYD_09600 [Desulfobacterota bacterium M19]
MTRRKTGSKTAFELFPELMSGIKQREAKPRPKAEVPPITSPEPAPVPPKKISPPQAPDLGWLQKDERRRKRISAGDAALLLMPDNQYKSMAIEIIGTMGYNIWTIKSLPQAVSRAAQCQIIIVDTEIIGRPEQSPLHQRIINLPMTVRRYIYYAIIGPQFHTLYDLEALALSANLVINYRDLASLKTILSKGLCSNVEFFAPLIQARRHNNSAS